jgi:hypothetical protein
MKLCHRSGHSVTQALHILANTIPIGSHSEPPVFYDRVGASRNKSHRPYRVFLRRLTPGYRWAIDLAFSRIIGLASSIMSFRSA